MPQQRDRPLAHGWAGVEAKLRAGGKHNDVQIELARLMFYFGAKIAIMSAARSPMSLMLMSMELREFDQYAEERTNEIAKDSTCQPVNIS